MSVENYLLRKRLSTVHLRCIQLSKENQFLRKGLKKIGYEDVVAAHRDVRSRSTEPTPHLPLTAGKFVKPMGRSLQNAAALLLSSDKNHTKLDEILNVLSPKQIENHAQIIETFMGSKKKSFLESFQKPKGKLDALPALKSSPDVF